MRLGHEVDTEEVECIEEGNHECRDKFFIATAEQFAKVEREGLGIQGETHLTEKIDGQIEAAPSLTEEEVALRVSAADQSDTGAHEKGRDGSTDDPHGGA